MPAFEKLSRDVFYIKIPFGPVFTGCTLINGDEKILIDSGASAQDVDEILLPALEDKGIKPGDLTLLCTHTHGDHVGGHARLREMGVGRILCCEASAPKLKDPLPYAVATRSRFPDYSPKTGAGMKPVTPDGVLKDGEMVAGRLKMICSPGHDNDCVCFLDEQTGLLITGDSLQANGTICQGIGFYKSLPDYRATLEKMSALPVKAILCGHDYDGIGWYIEGENAVAEAFGYCKKRIEVYGSFIASHSDEDPAVIAEKLIKSVGCGMPPHLFMALYTVTEHLKEVSNHG